MSYFFSEIKNSQDQGENDSDKHIHININRSFLLTGEK